LANPKHDVASIGVGADFDRISAVVAIFRAESSEFRQQQP
jgi:hypothetical protein